MFTPSFLTLTLGWILAVGAPGPGQEQQRPVTELSTLLNSPNPEAFAGQRVDLSPVQVQQVLGPRVLLIGTPNHRLPVRLEQDVKGLRPGEMVAVSGVVNQMTVLPEGGAISGWNTNQLRGFHLWISATQVRILPLLPR